MNEELPRTDEADIPDAVAEPKRRFSIQLVWIVPILAAIIGGTLAVRAILERGPTITITFRTGEGLEAGKTKIKYKEVEIGEVKKVAISEDRSRVIVTARLGRESKGLLVEDTLFWVVRPRFYGGNVSGLGTLLGGTYIGVDVGKSAKPARTFEGLEVPPVVTTDAQGTTFFLRASDLGSLNITSPIFFRRLQVGQVVAYNLDNDGRGVTFTVFIRSPYDRFVKANTLFWHASGIDLKLGADGLKVNTESLVSILLGGIAFQTPEDKVQTPRALPNSAFSLFANREDAMKHAEISRTFLLVFRESIRGLSLNSPVEFRGVLLGDVTKIDLKFDPPKKDFTIMVEMQLYPDRLRGPKASGPRPPDDPRAFINELVERGLRARLGSANLLTGQRYVALEFLPKAPKAKINWNRIPPEFPTTREGEKDLQESLALIARKIDKMPLEEIAAEVRHAVRGLDQTLRSADRLLKRTDAEIVPEAHALLEEARHTLGEAREALSTDAPLQQDLRETLRELSRAARSVRILVDYLELYPESLIRGSIAFFRVAVLFLLCAVAGCARSPGVTFYTLSAMAPEATSPTSAPHAVAVGPVTLPELVDRPQLVIRVAANRVEILETHRWAESLKSEIPRLLAENLARLLRPARVSAFQQNASKDAEYRVLVDVQRFETVPGEGVTIEALWSVRRNAAGAIPRKGHSLAREPAGGTGYDALITAHGRALAAISGDIARALREEGE